VSSSSLISEIIADFSSARGYGTGGVAGIYEVANSTRSDCILQEPQPTGSWPVGLATNQRRRYRRNRNRRPCFLGLTRIDIILPTSP
jgi:hypothetical protein